jgi:hypothetical protein
VHGSFVCIRSDICFKAEQIQQYRLYSKLNPETCGQSAVIPLFLLAVTVWWLEVLDRIQTILIVGFQVTTAVTEECRLLDCDATCIL